MKKIVNIILILFVLVTFSNAQVNVEVSNHSLNIGETFTATIQVKPNGDSIGVAAFNILYDDALINKQDIQVGNSLSGFYNDSTSGIVYFTGINADGIENDFLALSITFETISSTTLFSNLNIMIEQLTDQNGNSLTCNKTDGLLNLNQANCVNNLFVGNISNPSTTVSAGIYQATECVESSGVIMAGTPGEIVFKAGEKVNLLSGFEVQNAALFSIMIEGCD